MSPAPVLGLPEIHGEIAKTAVKMGWQTIAPYDPTPSAVAGCDRSYVAPRRRSMAEQVEAWRAEGERARTTSAQEAGSIADLLAGMAADGQSSKHWTLRATKDPCEFVMHIGRTGQGALVRRVRDGKRLIVDADDISPPKQALLSMIVGGGLMATAMAMWALFREPRKKRSGNGAT